VVFSINVELHNSGAFTTEGGEALTLMNLNEALPLLRTACEVQRQ
jgi:hypothetical protein